MKMSQCLFAYVNRSNHRTCKYDGHTLIFGGITKYWSPIHRYPAFPTRPIPTNTSNNAHKLQSQIRIISITEMLGHKPHQYALYRYLLFHLRLINNTAHLNDIRRLMSTNRPTLPVMLARWRFCVKGAKRQQTRLILGLRPVNERRRYKVTPFLIGWAQNLESALNLTHANLTVTRVSPGSVTCIRQHNIHKALQTVEYFPVILIGCQSH